MRRLTILTLAAFALLCALSSPVFELAACPVLNPHSPSHPCCPRPSPKPTHDACISACVQSAAVALPVKLLEVRPDSAVVAALSPAITALPLMESGFVLQPAGFSGDERDLYLRLGVIRR